MSQRKKWKIQRALGPELPDLGKPGALEKRNYPPGQHGKARKPPQLPLPSFLQFEHPDVLERGVLFSIPDSRHVPFEFSSVQVAEYYAKRGV